MVAVVEVDAGQAVKRSEATDEEGKTPPPPQPQPMRAVRRQRQPTPDHPPYCWMIGEAIDALCENGGSEEDSISAFIRARYPGVPDAHDRILRYYLDKHVAEGFFVFTAEGRYLRCPEGNTVVESPVEPAAAGSSEETCVGSPVPEAKRGRGRPRKDGSSSTSPAGNKDGVQSVTPNCPVRKSPAVERPMQLAAAGSSKEVAEAMRGRGRPRKDGSSLTPPAGKKDGAVSSTPKSRGRRRAVAPLVASEDCVPPASLVAAAEEEDRIQAASSTPKRRGRLRKLGMATTPNSSGKVPVAGKKDRGEVPSTTNKEHEPPSELALVIVNSTTTSIMDKACAKAPPTTPAADGDQSLELALVTTTGVPVPMPVPTPAMGDEDSRNAPSFNLAVVAKNDSICATPTALESSSQACELALVVADDASVPVLVADKEGVEAAPSATNKHVRQPRKAGSAPTAGKKAGGKDLSATPKARLLRQRKPAVVATDGSALTPVAGRKAGRKASASPRPTPVTAGGCSTPASVADLGIEACKLYPMTADEIPDDPGFCLLALPSLTAAANV
ncbi:unnamed protein product [Urochloa decumbens]|uniref:H15 domain-containing protein n=1 Tax=Urochloa decumbens TaxID=240449 RepID=A0ABC9D488_9POAL